MRKPRAIFVSESEFKRIGDNADADGGEVEYRSGRHVDLLHKLETLYRASENLKYASDKLHGTRHSGLGYCCKYAAWLGTWGLDLLSVFRFSLFLSHLTHFQTTRNVRNI